MATQKLLGIDTNAKTVKGQDKGYLTGILYMIPNDTICPASKVAGCREGCLVSAGRGVMSPVKAGRAKKTAFYQADKEAFYAQLRTECQSLIKRAAKRGLIPVVRLNGTSDIDHTDFIASVPELQFYDYTKRVALVEKAKSIPNYHVTFSYSAKMRYSKHVEAALELGANLAVIFRTKTLPQFFMGLPVISGDETDLRFTDNNENDSQVVVGLYAKGKMKKDTGSMVVDIPDNLIAMA
jgi:hypothetical protein